jgi:AraC family transcriptional regulator
LGKYERNIFMEPTAIIEKGSIILVGFSFFGDPFSTSAEWTEENEIGRLWHRFMAYLMKNQDCIKHIIDNELAYEVHVEHEETKSKGYSEVFVGMEVEQLEDLPVEVLTKILPPTTYAVFTLKGQQISSDWPKMIGQWMSGAGYQQAYKYGFQLYDQRFKGVDKIEESELDVYVPVERLS